MNEHIRTWANGNFRLELFDTHQTDHYGKAVLAYRFFHGEAVVFEGADFHCSPMHSIDGDATVAGLLAFLSLRPGDTDREYFDSYTPAQLEFAQSHGEELAVLANDLEERRLPEPGSVSSGSLREEDLIPAFEETLDAARVHYNRPAAVDKLLDGEDLTDSERDEVSWYVNESLFDALNEIAPEGCYFGAHPGDGADFGYWSVEGDE